MKIRFKESRVVQDEHVGTDRETRFEAGREYDLPAASAQRWINRGAAEAVGAAATTAPAPASEPTPGSTADVPLAPAPSTSATDPAPAPEPKRRRGRDRLDG